MDRDMPMKTMRFKDKNVPYMTEQKQICNTLLRQKLNRKSQFRNIATSEYEKPY